MIDCLFKIRKDIISASNNCIVVSLFISTFDQDKAAKSLNVLFFYIKPMFQGVGMKDTRRYMLQKIRKKGFKGSIVFIYSLKNFGTGETIDSGDIFVPLFECPCPPLWKS